MNVFFGQSLRVQLHAFIMGVAFGTFSTGLGFFTWPSHHTFQVISDVEIRGQTVVKQAAHQHA